MMEETGDAQRADAEFRRLCSDLTLQTKKDGFFKVHYITIFISNLITQFQLLTGLCGYDYGSSQSRRIRNVFQTENGQGSSCLLLDVASFPQNDAGY